MFFYWYVVQKSHLAVFLHEIWSRVIERRQWLRVFMFYPFPALIVCT